jgi:Mg-chelatase subunit ChlD/sugar lactone lactonase YvrE
MKQMTPNCLLTGWRSPGGASPDPVARRRGHLVLRAGTAALMAVLWAGPAGARPGAAAPPRQAEPSIGYRLADTWANQPWSLTAGRYGMPADISSAPDGTITILDGRHQALHVLAPDGRPREVWELPRDPAERGPWSVRRLDVGFDGVVHVLSEGQRQPNGWAAFRVTRLGADGREIDRFDAVSDGRKIYNDVAVGPDGRVYLSVSTSDNPFVIWPGPTPTPDPNALPVQVGVEVFSIDGDYQKTITDPGMCSPDSLDVAANGTLYVINKCPSPFGNVPPGPTPTPRPSLAFEPTPAPATKTEGVYIFAADHRLVEKVPFNGPDDVAVGPAGVFISRVTEIFALRDPEPLFSGLSGRLYSAYFDQIVFHLDVPADGRVLASMTHCYFQGLVSFARPADRPAAPNYLGVTDQPEIEGPVYPIRVAAGEEVAVLQGQYYQWDLGQDQQYVIRPSMSDAQSVQRWTRQGAAQPATRLRSQAGLCAGDNARWIRDVASDGTDIYTIDPTLLQLRPDDTVPAWSFWPGTLTADPDVKSRLQAVSADAGRVAILDVGTQQAIVLDRAKTVLQAWSVAGLAVNALPVDLVLSGDRVYLADAGRNRVLVRGLDGAAIDEWPIHDGPVGLAVGPGGDVFVLGRGRWAFRYRADGELVTSWPMPDRARQAGDVAVDRDGRVYVTTVQRTPIEGPGTPVRDFPKYSLGDAAVWVFEEVRETVPPPVPLPPGACLASRDKVAAPRRLPLGDEVEVRLDVSGLCPGRMEPVQIVLALDVSRSMNYDDALSRAQDEVASWLGRLDPRSVEVGLVTFSDGAGLEVPLTRDLAAVRARVASLVAWGDTRMGVGLDAALAELTGARGNPAAKRLILLVTDGVYKDEPLTILPALRAAGVDVAALVYWTREYDQAYRLSLESLTGDPSRVLLNPDADQVEALTADLAEFREEPGLFETLTIEDEIPANMRYVPDSAQPPAELRGSTLVWTFGAIPASRPITLSYRLVPQEVGIWPTNVQATASYRDALGNDGRLVFPIPEVEVYKGYTAYLPFAAKAACQRIHSVDVVLVLDTSSSMLEPAADGVRTKLGAAREAAGAFLAVLRLPVDRAAVVAFNESARRAVDLTGDRAALWNGLQALQSIPGTRIDLGLAVARAIVAERPPTLNRPVVILLTDGLQNGSVDPVLAQADALKHLGTLVYTIGLGQEIDRPLLRAVATSPDRTFESPTDSQLQAIYGQISDRLACDVNNG